MITKSDWQSVKQELMADERRRLEPPTAEEALAYTRGELSAEEEARIQERLVCYPELVRTLTAEFPAEGAEPGDPDYVTDAEFTMHWEAMKKRMSPAPREGRVLQFWRWTAAVAATIAIVLGGSLWQATIRMAQPRVVWDQQVLYPDGRRGGGQDAVLLTGQGESVLLAVPLIGQRDYTRYRLEIVDAGSARAVWSSGPLAPRDDETFVILVPRRFFEPGLYQVAVYGITGAAEERLATYSVRVPVRP